MSYTAAASHGRGPAADTTAPSPASPPRRLASAPPAVASSGDASGGSSPSSHSGELAVPDPPSQLLAIRSEEYKLLFRLPPDEVLVQDFNCALQENILLQGHMYLFLHHICFYSNIFGYETKKTIPLQEVSIVRRAKTAAIFPNAIEIIAGGKRYFFGSFLSRDEAYRIIVDGWAQHSSEATAVLERQDTKSASSSEDNGYVLLEGSKESKLEEDSPSLDSFENGDERLLKCRSVNGTIASSGTADITGGSDINVSKRFSDVQENGTEENSIPLKPFSWEPVDDDAPNVPECYTMITESKFQVPVESLFNALMSDGAFGFLDDFHKKCGDKEFRCSPWRQDGQAGLVRDVSFLHPIKIYLGAKFGSCQEVQKLRVYKNRHLVINTSQQIGDAPYGDHFTVEGIWDIEQDIVDGNSCYLRVYLNVAFSKKTIFRGKIEQSTKDECRDVFGLWIKLGHDLLKQKSDSQSKGAANLTNTDVQSGATLDSENPLEASVPTVTSLDNPGTRHPVPPILDPQKNSLQEGFIASTSRELWDSFMSYTRSSQFGPMLAVALVAIIILMQVMVIILLARSPKVYMVGLENSLSSAGNYGKENIEWLRKRLSSLSEEMLLAEAHMERMQHEFAWLKAYLERLDRLRNST